MDRVREYFGGDTHKKKAAIITTASEDKERNEFAVLARFQFKEAGFGETAFFDIEKQDPEELRDFDVIYVNGGNTYYLLYWTKKSGFDFVLRKFVTNGGLYVGVSAGSIIAGPSIEVLDYTKGDPNDINFTDLSGMGFISQAIIPHYEMHDEKAITAYEKKSGVEVVRLRDGIALLGAAGGGFELIR
jgi:dipeptidase E